MTMAPGLTISRIATAFDAALDYDAHAHVQRRTAAALADRIAAQPIVAARSDRLRLLEIGCGTGLLTQALQERRVGGHWLVSDVAPRMVSRCAAAMAGRGRGPTIAFMALDGAAPPATLRHGSFDVVCSSMAFQWFGDLGGALMRIAPLLAPGGVLSFSTLLRGTFAEWEQAHHRLGLDAGGLRYPALEDLSGLFPAEGSLTISEFCVREVHSDAADFLRSLKRIGAGTPRSGHRPLSPAALHGAMAAFESAGATVTYRVALCSWTSPHSKDDDPHD
jgi:malonyl-CoA O-methyltransferase